MVTVVEFMLVFIYVYILSLHAGNAELIVFVVGHDVMAQQTGKNRKFLTSFSSLPRSLPLAHIGWPVHCDSLFLREAPAQGLRATFYQRVPRRPRSAAETRYYTPLHQISF